MSPTPTPAPGWDCINVLPIPPQPHRCYPTTTLADLGQGTGSGMDTALDSARDLASAPADPAHAAALHDLIYPSSSWWADLSTAQLASVGAVLIVLTALMVAVLVRRQGGAS